MYGIKFFVLSFCMLVSIICSISATPDGKYDNDGGEEYNQSWREMDQNAFEQLLQHYEPQQQNNKRDENQRVSLYGGGDAYEQKQQQTLANVIPQQQQPQTLAEIYKKTNAQNRQVLAYYEFPYDFYRINPRDPNSSFSWFPQSALLGAGLADNAAFKLVGEYGREKSSNEYGQSEEKLKYGEPGYLQLTSLPYTNQLYQEGFIGTKQNYNVSNTERFLGRMKLSCKTIDADKNPFNATEVSRPHDDPRLAGCHFQMTNANFTGPLFWFTVINKSVWAVYAARTFIARRKVGVRERYDSMVDAGLELDNRQQAVNYYLNGHKVWSINSIGVPPPDDGINHINLGTLGTPTLIRLTQVDFSFGTGKRGLDETDPYTSDTTRLVRIQPADRPFYTADTKFYDPEGKRSNIVWGQGDIMKVYKLLIVKTESVQLRQSKALPGVYGASTASNRD